MLAVDIPAAGIGVPDTEEEPAEVLQVSAEARAFAVSGVSAEEPEQAAEVLAAGIEAAAAEPAEEPEADTEAGTVEESEQAAGAPAVPEEPAD